MFACVCNCVRVCLYGFVGDPALIFEKFSAAEEDRVAGADEDGQAIQFTVATKDSLSVYDTGPTHTDIHAPTTPPSPLSNLTTKLRALKFHTKPPVNEKKKNTRTGRSVAFLILAELR